MGLKESLTANIAKIRNAVYGKQVRTAIADSIEGMGLKCEDYASQAAGSATAASGSATTAANEVKTQLQTYVDQASTSATNAETAKNTAVEKATALTNALTDIADLKTGQSSLQDNLSTVDSTYPDEIKTIVANKKTIDSAIGNCSGSGVIDTTNTARRHTDYLLISEYEKFGISDDFKSNRLYWVRCFSDVGVYVGSANNSTAVNTDTTSSSILNSYPTAKYVVLAIKKASDGSMADADGGAVAYKYEKEINPNKSLDDVYVSKYKKSYTSNDIALQYSIDNDGHFTKGWLKLPPNYTRNGKAVPLVVFVHGSSDFANIDAQMTNLYNDYYNYIKNCGYAVFDCYPWGNKYTNQTGGYTNTWGVPVNRQCYVSGINYVCDKYNISKDNIFVASKSLGGVQALSMLFDDTIPIKGAGMLAPLLNPFEVYLGYDKVTRTTVTKEMGFAEDTDNVLEFDGTPTDAYWQYVTDNMGHWVGNVAFFDGLGIKNADKPSYYHNKPGFLDLIRYGNNRPLKIWIAEDDSALVVSANAIVKSLNNGGNKAEINLLPENTGGHHAVDNSPLALQKTDVTTRCGVHYDTVPLAYYELVEWFDKWCTL